jgi:single-strand DNA-binding protein
MASFNQAIIIGNVVRDPGMKYSTSGTAICTFTVATNYYRRTPEGKFVPEPEFHDCIAFKDTAERIAQYMVKGSLILIQSRLKTDRWEDDHGVKRQRTRIIVERFVCGPKKHREPGEDDERWTYPTSEPDSKPRLVDVNEDVPF